MHPQVQLAAETTAAGSRDHPNGVLRQPHNIGDLVPVHIRRLGGDSYLKSVSYATGPACFGFDIAMFDEPRLIVILDHDIGSFHRGRSVALFDKSFCHDVAGMIIVNTMGVFGQRRVEAVYVIPLFIVNWHVFVANTVDAVIVADQRDHVLAFEADLSIGESWLILHIRVYTVSVEARHIGRGQNPF